MFPYKDDNPTLRFPVVTLALIALNVAAWALVQGLGSAEPLARSLCEKGLIPGSITGLLPVGVAINLGPDLVCRFDGRPDYTTIVWSMFLHGGWLHLLGNMWFLWVFGNNVEDAMGPVRFIVFYLLCGAAAAGAQVLMEPGSAIPMVGASGAIGGVMGAYIALYPKVRVHMLIFLVVFVTTIQVPAYFMLGFWALSQVAGSLTAEAGRGGTAFMAHIGGFVAGLLLIQVFQDRALVEAHRRFTRQLYAGRA